MCWNSCLKTTSPVFHAQTSNNGEKKSRVRLAHKTQPLAQRVIVVVVVVAVGACKVWNIANENAARMDFSFEAHARTRARFYQHKRALTWNDNDTIC